MIPIYRTDPYLYSHLTVIDSVAEEQDSQLVICRELIFAEGGGQPRDYGSVTVNNETRKVLELIKHKGDVRLRINTIPGLKKGDAIQCDIDSKRRQSIMRLHTAQHGFAGAFRMLMPDYQTGGMSISDDAAFCSMHFTVDSFVKDEAIKNGLEILGEARQASRIVSAEIYESAEIARQTLGNLFRSSDPKVQLKGKARVVTIDKLDANACGGTHVRNFSEIGEPQINNIVGNEHGGFTLTFSLSE